MERKLVISITVLLLCLLLYAAWNAKSAYRLLPANIRDPLPLKPFSNWRDYRSTDGDFSIKFPDIAQHATDTVGDRDYDMTVAERANGTTFVVTRITFTGAEADEKKRSLESFRDDIVAAKPRNQVIRESSTVVAGHPALDFEMDSVDSHSYNQLFFVGDTLYMIMMMAPTEFYHQEDADYYLNSFQLHPSKP